jgi:zinc protease
MPAVAWADTVRFTHVDGVPTVWAPLPGALTASLMFRVGRVDEALPWSGITHLVEHLSLFELGPTQPYSYNGAVTPARTYFVASGTADDITAFFAHVTNRLHALPLARLEAEKTVLLAEATSRPLTPGDLLFGMRYGAQGHGLYLYDEFALRQVSAETVQSWARHWFTRENAVLCMSGKPPLGLRLNLPQGARMSEPPSYELTLTLPAYAQRRVGGAGAGMVGTRSSELILASNIVARRALDSLRYKQGIAYHVGSNYLPTGPERAHVTFWTDCEQVHAGAVLSGLVSSVYDVATVGPTQDELKSEVDQFRKSIERDDAAMPWLDRTAVRILSGERPQHPAEALADFDKVTPVAARGALAAAARTGLWLAPPGVPTPPGFAEYGQPITPRLVGLGLHHVRNAVWQVPPRLVLAQEGVTLGLNASEAVTVRVDSCAAVLRYGDGGRALVGNDGALVLVNPAEWISGETAVAHVDTIFPAHLAVTIPIATTPLAIEVPPPAAPSAGLAGISIGKLVTAGAFAAVGLILVGFLIASIGTTGSRVSVPSLAVWAVVGYRLLKRWS